MVVFISLKKSAVYFFVKKFFQFDVSWENDTITTNSVYVWHNNTPSNQIKLAQKLANKFMDVVMDELENGVDPYPVIAS